MATLTTANSALALAFLPIYPIAQNIQGYATDDAFAADDVEPAEVMMGVDGKLSAGYTPYPTKLNITLQADSESNDIFDNVLLAQKAAKEVFFASGIISIQGTGKKYALNRGVLSSVSVMPSSKKVLQPRKFVITFEDCIMSPI